MANGLLGKAALAASTYTIVGTVPTNQSGTVNIRLVNRDVTTASAIRLAICPSSYTSGAPANADYIEPLDLFVPAGGILEETAIAVSSGENIVAYANSANVTVRVFGYLK